MPLSGTKAWLESGWRSMLESLEGKRGMVRFKPPLPAIEGLFGKPTVINNVITFASVPIILDKGAKYYADYGMSVQAFAMEPFRSMPRHASSITSA